MTYDAFISYRRSDRITADGVARFLDAFGLKVFVDRSSRAGTAWEPELRAALASAKVLVVLWSRSAARSDWVEQEWRSVAPDCRVVPIKLDGEKLPDDLNRLTAVEGLDVGSRLLQRTFELMQQGRLSPAQAQEQLVQELAADGTVLEPKKREALGIFLGFVAGVTGALAVTQLSPVAPAAPQDSLPPAAASHPPPPGIGAGKWASLLGAVGVTTAAAFAIGYWWHERSATLVTVARECPSVSIPNAVPAAVACPPASTCPPAPTCSPCEAAKLPACPCSQEQCARNATSPAVAELKDRLLSCQTRLDATTAALNTCNLRKVEGRATSTKAQTGPALAAGGTGAGLR